MIELVNEDGTIVGRDPETGETVPISLGDLEVDGSVDGEEARVTGETDVTISVPSDYNTLEAAFEAASSHLVRSGTRVEVNIESGHQIGEHVELADGDWSHVTLTSEDASVTVADASITTGAAVISVLRGRGPHIDTVIDCNNASRDDGQSIHGLRVRAGDAYISGGVKNAAVDNLNAFGSHVWCAGADFTGAGDRGIRADKGSRVIAHNADVSGSSYGVYSVESSAVGFREGLANNCGDRALSANRGGYLCAHGAEATGAGFINALASDLSLLDCRNAILDDAAEYACFARRGGRLLADRAQINDPGVCAHYVEKGGIIQAWNTDGNANGAYGSPVPQTDGEIRAPIRVQEGVWTKAGLIVADGVSDGAESWNDLAFGASSTNGSISLSAGVDTEVEFDNIHADPRGNWDASISGYTVPESGIWEVSAQTWFRGSTSGDQLWFSAGTGGAFSVGSDGHVTATQIADSGDNTLSVSRKLRLEETNTFRVWAKNDTSSDELGSYESMTFVDLSFVRPYES